MGRVTSRPFERSPLYRALKYGGEGSIALTTHTLPRTLACYLDDPTAYLPTVSPNITQHHPLSPNRTVFVGLSVGLECGHGGMWEGMWVRQNSLELYLKDALKVGGA